MRDQLESRASKIVRARANSNAPEPRNAELSSTAAKAEPVVVCVSVDRPVVAGRVSITVVPAAKVVLAAGVDEVFTVLVVAVRVSMVETTFSVVTAAVVVVVVGASVKGEETTVVEADCSVVVVCNGVLCEVDSVFVVDEVRVCEAVSNVVVDGEALVEVVSAEVVEVIPSVVVTVVLVGPDFLKSDSFL